MTSDSDSRKPANPAGPADRPNPTDPASPADSAAPSAPTALSARLRAHDPDTLRNTRIAVHAVAEHVLAGTRHRAVGRIGLRADASRVVTPEFADANGRPLTLAISIGGGDVALLVSRPDDPATDVVVPLTGGVSLAAAASAAGLELGAPDNYPTATQLDPAAPLAIDADCAADLVHALALGADALAQAAAASAGASEMQLWPEHLDLCFSAEEVNYGVSPGDDAHPLPYAYVGPWNKPDDADWPEPWGYSLSLGHTSELDDIVRFLLTAAK